MERIFCSILGTICSTALTALGADALEVIVPLGHELLTALLAQLPGIGPQVLLVLLDAVDVTDHPEEIMAVSRARVCAPPCSFSEPRRPCSGEGLPAGWASMPLRLAIVWMSSHMLIKRSHDLLFPDLALLDVALLDQTRQDVAAHWRAPARAGAGC